MSLINVTKLSQALCEAPIKADLKYATSKNFVGRVIAGYDTSITDIAFMTPKAAHQLCLVQNKLIQQYAYGLLIFDAYRPKRAVMDFLHWSKQKPVSDYELERKEKHYPHIQKNQLFELGYLIEDSGHCYGNTVDLFLLDINTGKPLAMGARFDFMDPLSRTTASGNEIGEQAYMHRGILSETMLEFGFHPYVEEFWHFSHGGKQGREVLDPMNISYTTLKSNRGDYEENI
jgi:D-alanyl-D-alanine dipeptidase